jgi:sarcosine oxidase, subunit alpha
MKYRQTSGGRVDRSKVLNFTFDGKKYQGLAGDTLASALIANGIHLVGRSFKYHRPRGILSAGSDEPNALVGVGGSDARYTPNLRATQVELYDGLVAESQNRWPSLSVDFGSVNGLFSSFLTAGFYYKTFMWPAAAWKMLYEPMIRKAAGLGKTPLAPDPDRYTQVYAHCDVLIAGAGPSGLAAALAAGRSGSRVILCDEQDQLGGSLLAEHEAVIDGQPAADWLARTIQELSALVNVTLLPRTTAFGWYPHNFLGLCQRVTDHLGEIPTRGPRERMWQVRAKEVVLATGSIERPLLFPDNDRPGVMMAEAARTYLNRYGAIPGSGAIVFTACDGAYRAALELKNAGVYIAAIADIRSASHGPWIERARNAGIDVRFSTVVTATYGRLRISHASLTDETTGKSETLPCDLLLMSGGFTPSVHLFSQSRGKLTYDENLEAYVPGESAERERSVGACRGIFELGAAIANGFSGGLDAVKASGGNPVSETRFPVFAQPLGQDGVIGCPSRVVKQAGRAWVDFQNDVTVKDIELATREGFCSIEHVKRYTTTGMATDQGKTSNMNALGIVSQTLGIPISKVGLTTFRPPFTPTTFGAFAGQSNGELFDPVRKTSIHDWAEEHGAVFEDVSLWKGRGYACGGQTRMRGDATIRRYFRCLDPRQDRSRRKGRRRVSEPHVHECLDEARAGQAALWRHAARRRLYHG